MSSGIYSVLDDERINARSSFFEGLGASFSAGFASRIGTLIPSDTETEQHNDIGSVPQLAVWEGDIKAHELARYTASLTNVEYATALRIKKSDLRRDKTGRLQNRIGELGRRAGQHWDSLVAGRILVGETDGGTDLFDSCFDGSAFFATSHSYVGSAYTTSQSNLLSGTNLDVTTAASPTNDEMALVIRDLITHMWTLKDDNGEPINGDARNFMVVVGTQALAGAAFSAVGLQNLASGASNPLGGLVADLGMSIDVRLEPRLSSLTTKVHVFRTDSSLGPFILQDEDGPNLDEDKAGPRSKYTYLTVEATRNVGFGRWTSAVAGTLS